MTDDHSAEVFGAYGNDIVRTPNLDQLAAEGVHFTRAFTNAPVCTPARASIVTGRLPHATGVTLLRSPLPDTTRTIAEHLQEQGFATGAVGKMDFKSDLTHGFDYRVTGRDFHQYRQERTFPPRPDSIEVRPPWRPFDDPARVWLNADGRPSGHRDENSEGTYYARSAVDFLENNQSRRFCLWVSFHEPHSPFNFPVEFADRYDPASMPLPQQGPEDEQWMPDEFESLRPDDKRGIIRSYYSSIEYADKNVGLVLDALDRLGLTENTLVIYLTDHGYLLGEHGRFEKHMMWEPIVRSPLVIRGPGWGSRVEDALVEYVDLLPTILGVLDVPPMRGLHGRSLVPLLTGDTVRHRSAVFSEFLADKKFMVRTERWKYIFTTGRHDLAQNYQTGNGPPGIDHRLYDLHKDPGEFRDLADDLKYSGVIKYLQQRLYMRLLRTHPHADELPDRFSLVESLVWFAEPPERSPWQVGER
jgi:arylsulfatase A-like enzyme